MRGSFRIAAVAAVVFALAAGAGAEEKAKKAPSDAEIAAALENAMTPGEGQKKLGFMVGTFDAKIPDVGHAVQRLRPRTTGSWWATGCSTGATSR